MALSKPKAKYVRETRASLIESMVGEYERYQELLENNVEYRTVTKTNMAVKFRVYYTLNNKKFYTTISLEAEKFDMDEFLKLFFVNETNLVFNGVEMLKMEKVITNYIYTKTFNVEKFKFKYGYYNRADDRRYRDDTVYYSSSNFEKAKGFALKFYDKVFSDSYYVYFRNYSFSGVFPYNETREEKIERKTMINKEELNVREGYKPNIEWIKINPFFTSSRLLLETKGFRVWNVQTHI